MTCAPATDDYATVLQSDREELKFMDVGVFQTILLLQSDREELKLRRECAAIRPFRCFNRTGRN